MELMEVIKTILITLNAIMGISIIILVLLQKGKGANAGATFGASSTSFFGAAGAANFLSRSTAICATVFFLSALGLGYISKQDVKDLGIASSIEKERVPPSIPDDFQNQDEMLKKKPSESSTPEEQKENPQPSTKSGEQNETVQPRSNKEMSDNQDE